MREFHDEDERGVFTLSDSALKERLKKCEKCLWWDATGLADSESVCTAEGTMVVFVDDETCCDLYEYAKVYAIPEDLTRDCGEEDDGYED